MKKSMLVLTAALTFGGLASAQTAATASAPQVPAMTDVPAGHWAKDAIDRLISKGIILGYPDGTFRGTQNLTRYEAAVIIARLLDQINTGTVAAPAGEDLTALQNAVQELAADLAALGVRVSDLEENAVSKDDFARLEARVEELAGATGDADAVAKIQAQIDDLTARADDYDTLRADVDDNASSIAALNDLTVLLNQDILDLQDRVSAVEAAQADFVQRSDFDNLSGKVTAIDTRVTTLEGAPKFSVTGQFGANYGRIALTQGSTNFDVDRLTRQTFADNVFSNGRIKCWDDKWNSLGNPVACMDTGYNHQYITDSYMIFGVHASNLKTANGALVMNNGDINFYVDNFMNGADGVKANIDNISMSGTLNGQKFDVRYEPYRSSFKFNDYLFANDNYWVGTDQVNGHRGMVANIQADQLPLKPKLTIVLGTASPFSEPTPTMAGSYYGLRASVNPAGMGTVGVSYAQMDGNSAYPIGRSAAGIDADLGFGVKNAAGNSPFTLKGQYVGSVANNPSSFVANGKPLSGVQSAGFIDGKADLGVVKVAANFRAVHPAYADGVASMSTNYSNGYPGPGKTGVNGYPYAENQVGFGGAAAANLGPVALAAYGDSRTPWVSNGKDRTNNFGASAGVKFAGVSLLGFYNRSTFNNTIQHKDWQDGSGPAAYSSGCGGFCYNVSDVYMDVANVPFNYSSNYGAKLSHDGKAADALVKGLNFTVADAYFYGDKANDFQIYGDYSGTFAGITIAPFARYHMFSVPGNTPVVVTNPSDSTTSITAYSYNTIKYGVKLSTQPFTNIPLQPSFFGNFAQRQSKATNATPDTSSETFAQVGLTLNQAFVPNLKASIGYAYYAAKNVGSLATASSASGSSATYGAAADRIYRSPLSSAADPYTGGTFGTATGNLNGIFAQADWNGLQANYGIFRYNDTNTPANNSVAQAFKVGYTFKF